MSLVYGAAYVERHVAFNVGDYSSIFSPIFVWDCI